MFHAANQRNGEGLHFYRECWEYIGTDSRHEPVVEPKKSVQSGVSGWWDFFNRLIA